MRTYQRMRAELAALHAAKHDRTAREPLPALPVQDAEGHFPARETLRVILARNIIARRKATGLTQAGLAKLAGVRQETLSRLESGKHAPTVTTVDKIDTALKRLETHTARGR
jgi:DNA-binding XRE family transcriptional regulator